MRITNTSIARNYTASINKNLAQLNYSNMKVQSGQKFRTMGEDTASAVRALTVRRNISQLESYKDNATDSLNKFDGADKTLGQIAQVAQDVYARYNYAVNGTNSKAEREVVATEFERLQEEVLTLANGQYSDKFMFGGTNTQSIPFTLDENKELLYNGVKLKDIQKGDPNGQYNHLFEDAAYIDIGLGLTMDGNSQDVIKNSAFKNTINGLDFMGTGDTNLYDTIGDLIKSLRAEPYDKSQSGAFITQIQEAGNKVNLERTRIGSDYNYLGFTVSRLETENDNLIAQQQSIEIADPYEAITDFNMQQYVYNAALQMGSKLLQPSIFNFIN